MKLRDLPERFGEALKHAGVGVTVTSTTDIIVFLVGGTTVLFKTVLFIETFMNLYFNISRFCLVSVHILSTLALG